MATNKSTVGSGKDYTLWETWESATDIDLVAAGDIEQAEVYDDDSASHQAIGTTTDASNYRQTFPVAGSEWDPIAATGITYSGFGFNTFFILEDFFRLSGMRVHQTSGGGECLGLENDNFLIERVDCHMANARNGANVNGAGTFRNCIFRTDSAGIQTGVRLRSNGIDSKLQNCVVYNFNQGFFWDLATVAGTEVTNCAGVGNSATDWVGTMSLGTLSNNLSSDTSAPGTSSQESKSAADTFVDVANDNFTMKAGSAAIDNGVDNSADFTEDFNGDTRTGTWDIGVYFDAGGPAPFLPVSIRQRKINPLLVR